MGSARGREAIAGEGERAGDSWRRWRSARASRRRWATPRRRGTWRGSTPRALPERSRRWGVSRTRSRKRWRVLQARAKFDVGAYIAAWGGVKRGAKWGSDLLHAGLQDPARAEVAASAIEGKDPGIEPFLPDVESALERLGASGATATLAAVLAAAGPPAHDAVVRRLADKVTRGAMCGGISVTTGSTDARVTLRVGPGNVARRRHLRGGGNDDRGDRRRDDEVARRAGRAGSPRRGESPADARVRATPARVGGRARDARARARQAASSFRSRAP